jgi:Zn-dependent peptidase ImmA (M78 family)
MNQLEIDRIAEDLRSMAAVQRPVHLQSIAKKLGVAEIRQVQIEEDGRLSRIHGQTIIELRSDHSFVRRRFTFAHELVHLYFDTRLNRETPIARRTSDPGGANEERICDAVAAALLMPTRAVEEIIGDKGISLSLIEKLAHKSRCSLPASATRVAEVTETEVLLTYIGKATERGVNLQPVSRRPSSCVGRFFFYRDGKKINWQSKVATEVTGILDVGREQRTGRVELRRFGSPKLALVVLNGSGSAVSRTTSAIDKPLLGTAERA